MRDFRESFYSTVRENLGLTVYHTGIQQCTPNHKWGPALKDHFLIHYVVSGKGTFTTEKEKFQISAGDLFLIHPSQLVSYCADNNDPWEYIWVGFNGTEAERLLKLTSLSKTAPVLSCPDKEAVKNCISNIHSSAGSFSFSESRMTGYLYLLISHLIEMSSQKNRTANSSLNYVENALKYIQYNYSDNIGVEDIAYNVGLSRSHLHRIFIKNLSVSPNEFLTKFRINEACTLLKNSDLTINEIASSVGFSDPLYFSRVFKKIKGIPPSKYQKTQKMP
jgi:AraC-like DNA-binding protein